MNLTKHVMATTLVAFATMMPAWAQDDEFDLSAQRGEVQQYNPVDGHKIDHGGLVINPTPRNIDMPLNGGVLNISGGFKVDDKQHKLADALGFLKQEPKGVKLVIDFGAKVASKAGVKPVEGAYLLQVTGKDVKITGYDERGAFYGLQTLRQILDSELVKEKGGLPMMEINDYPSMKYRGVVEGFYGTPWSHDVRMSLIDFYGRNKMNDYLYGPKDDPYHSSPYWRLPYPEDQAKNIRELVEASKKARVNFIWAIHPGKDIRWNKEDYDSLVSKFNMMYDLGVRSFAIFFDDIEGEGTNPVKQAQLLNDLTNDFVKAKGDVTNLIVCPTDYSQLWAKPGPDGPLAVYGRDLNPDVEVFWTGAVVCSDLTPETLEFIDTRIKRPALYWWNYPVTDYVKHILLQGPVYGLDTSLTAEQVAGIESNPMEHGEASKLALYGVADYAWNTPAYNPLDNWERGLVEIVPEAPDAYRTFAIHSCDTENGYRRDESWETVTFPYNDYSNAQFDSLRNEFTKITGVEQILTEKANPALVKEMAPWLTQFTALGQRGLRTLDLIKTFESGDSAAFWTAYLANIMTPEQRAAYDAHKIGTLKLQPFYEKAMEQMAIDFYHGLTGQKPTMFRGVGTYPNLSTSQMRAMIDGDPTTFYTSAESQKDGDWIGIDMLQARPVVSVKMIQGRNSVDDGDYFDNVIIEGSADGKNWIALSPEMATTYEYEWTGDATPMRYVRLRRLDTERKSWAAVRELAITTATNPVCTDTKAAEVFDENPLTSMTLDGTVDFTRAADVASLLILSSGDKDLKLVQLDKKGKTLSTTSITADFQQVKLDPKAVRFQLEGKAQLYELIQR
ncbi:MAG: beta-N-acetylglucosaminidase domain-containing protein [Bacteroides sp.]|nr:beta-N-acetylglucosaminidase domain-containing protein [Bacteroides sp.]MCM1413926.1 beta-N-acetylglucosaminidase domain-containing protein [Bacteroides sp.]MCM1471647.1 beta-N-acetylglucosaminidase domain-containing protein [Bacteroides sp.]